MIIGLYAPTPKSGKSTVARVFQTAGYTPISFATPVKQSLAVVLIALGTKDTFTYLWGDKKDEIIPQLGVTGGYLMSTYATDYFREMIDQNVWLNIVKRQVAEGGRYIIDDLRFSNEYAWVREQGGKLIKVVRPDSQNEGRSILSEGNLDGEHFDFTIVNDTNLVALVMKSNEVLNAINSQ